MKKLPKYLANIGFRMLILGVFLLPNFAFAAVLLQQPNASVTSSLETVGVSFRFYVGQNLVGELTSVTVAASTTYTGVGSFDASRVDVIGYSDSSYTTQVTDCGYRKVTPNGTHLNGAYVLDDRVAGTVTDCTFLPNRYYKLEFTVPAGNVLTNWKGVNSSVSPFVAEVNNTDIGVPYVILTGINQSLDPNYIDNGNPSGISTSTVQQYCNSSYSTSTGLFSELANGITYGFCTVTTFLFVPNQNDLQNFYNLASTSQSKIPFSYFYETYNMFNSLSASSSTNLPTFAVDLPVMGTSTPLGQIVPSRIEFLSTTTIDRYYPSAIRTTFLTLGSYAIWVTAFVVIYRRIVPKKDLI